jgi:hypothetical protein
VTVADKTLYYVAFVPGSGRRGGVMLSRAYDTSQEAGAEARRLTAEDGSPFAVVVEFAGGRKTPLVDHVWPRAARVVVKHWEDVWAATE